MILHKIYIIVNENNYWIVIFLIYVVSDWFSVFFTREHKNLKHTQMLKNYMYLNPVTCKKFSFN